MVAIVKQPLAVEFVSEYVPVPASHFRVPVPVPLNEAVPPPDTVKFVLLTLASMMQPVVDAVHAPQVID